MAFRVTLVSEGATARYTGRPLAFSPAADFSGMSEEDRLYISAAIHQAYVKVNEEGTEAAAGTAVGAVATSLSPQLIFRADHPFVFLIRDNSSDSILFLGRLVQPQS